MPDAAGVDGLFGLRPDQFVAARNALAARLRNEGNASGAREVAGLRRPSVASWGLNQVARSEPERIAELLDVAAAAREAQEQALSDGGGAVRQASRRLQAIIREVAAEASERVTTSGVAASGHQGEMEAALRAASTDPETAAALRSGRLQATPSPPPGGLLGVAEAEPTGPPDRWLRRRLRDAQRAADDLARRMAALENERDRHQQELIRLRTSIDERERRLASLADELARLGGERRQAEQAIERTRRSFSEGTAG